MTKHSHGPLTVRLGTCCAESRRKRTEDERETCFSSSFSQPLSSSSQGV